MKLSNQEFNVMNLRSFQEHVRSADTLFSNTYLLVWVEASGIDSENLDVIYCLQSHQLYELVLPDSAKGLVISLSKNLIEVMNGFTYPPFEERLFSPYAIVSTVLEKKQKQVLQELLDNIKRENDQESITENQSEIVKVLIKLFLLRLSECKSDVNPVLGSREEMQLAKKYLDLIQVHFLEWKRVSDYAEYLCVTPNYLNAKIKKTTGFTASYHIQQRIVMEAKRQTRWRGLCMKEVAHYLGFDDMSHFSKFFKNSAGINFSVFQKGNSFLSIYNR